MRRCAEITELKDCRPEVREPPAGPVFEIGLVLAGAISGGAYTAGVLDFLFEALDAWHAAKAAEREKHGEDYAKWAVPPHDVCLKVISGASAGALCGAIAMAAARHKFTHVSLRDTSGKDDNPFYRAWVSDVDIRHLLTVEDFESSPELVSLLNCSSLDRIAAEALSYRGQPIDRDYLANPLRLVVSLTNLRGIRHALGFRSTGEARHLMREHRDWMSFALKGLGVSVAEASCGDEYPLEPINNTDASGWGKMAQAALASAAFPGGLRARLVKRPCEDYCYRRFPTGCNPDKPNQRAELRAYEQSLEVGSECDFVAVDGGAMNNEPLELARQFLAGPRGVTPRDGIKTKRGVIMVDPFPEAQDPEPDHTPAPGLLKVLGGTLTAWKNQCRFDPEELALAAAEDVYSRYMIAPNRGDGRADSADCDLAASALGGFGGFFSETFRRHDYFLGRRNCQRFLETTFCLKQGADLFSTWSPTLKGNPLWHQPERDELPIIPLMERLHQSKGNEEPLPAWPTGPALTGLKSLISARAEKVFEMFKRELDPVWMARLWLNVGWFAGGKSKLVDGVMARIGDDLKKRNLL